MAEKKGEYLNGGSDSAFANQLLSGQVVSGANKYWGPLLSDDSLILKVEHLFQKKNMLQIKITE